MTELDHHDICIIGAGVIGLAAAQKISSHHFLKNHSIVLLEQHAQFGQETSSRNSEVIHAGIYYPQHSLKALLCIEGREQLYQYCTTHDVPFRKTGKLIIADKSQEQALYGIEQQAINNGVGDLELLSRTQILAMESQIIAHQALYSPSSGIIDSHSFMQSLLHQAEIAGLMFSPLTMPRKIEKHPRGYLLETLCQNEHYTFTCTHLVNAAGLSAQHVSTLIDGFPDTEIPKQSLVKGSYFTLQGKSPFNHLIYPVPEKNLRGLGVHVTLDMAGQVKFGPDTEAIDDIDYSVDEGKEEKFRNAISEYFPQINQFTLQPAYSGIRPKLESTNSAADFIIHDGATCGYDGIVQLYGIESPGLTASLAIADEVVKLLLY